MESVKEVRRLSLKKRIILQAEEIKKLHQENEQLRAQVEKMKNALEHIAEYWNRDTNEIAMEDA